MTTLRDLLETLQGLPSFALDHPVALSITRHTAHASKDVRAHTEQDLVILEQDEHEAWGYPGEPPED